MIAGGQNYHFLDIENKSWAKKWAPIHFLLTLKNCAKCIVLDFNSFVGRVGFCPDDSAIKTDQDEENDESKDTRNEGRWFYPHWVSQETGMHVEILWKIEKVLWFSQQNLRFEIILPSMKGNPVSGLGKDRAR